MGVIAKTIPPREANQAFFRVTREVEAAKTWRVETHSFDPGGGLTPQARELLGL